MSRILETENEKSPVYNLKAVVLETGLKPPTLRAWERRYGLPIPVRSKGGHRQYSLRDIEMLKWLKSRQEEGISISHAVELWRSQVKEGKDPLRLQSSSDSVTAVSSITPVIGANIVELRQSWVSACLAFDRKSALQVLAQAFAQLSQKQFAWNCSARAWPILATDGSAAKRRCSRSILHQR
jgi:DNA-binding transcriptional MerR regulator